MFYILTKKIGCVPYFFQLIVSEERAARMFTSDPSRTQPYYGLYAELFRRKGDRSEAKENLSKAINIFKECSCDGWVEKYEKELAEL